MTTATIDDCTARGVPMPSPEQRLARQRASDKAAVAKGTMRIKFRQGLARQGASYERGDVAVWRADEAKRLVEAGIAVPAPQDKTRTAMTTPPEKRG